MRGKTHLIYGILVAVFSPSWLIGAATIVASVLPDIDSPKSLLGKPFFFLNHAATHRGFMHSIWAFILLAALLSLFWPSALVYVLAGYASHLVLDALNKKGIHLFYPFFHIRGFCKMGGIIEWCLFSVGILLIVGRIIAVI
ncbi:MAG: membrane-bound metal-dependent hydrolase YbcI (DUF457 family) [Candidatus Woesearchaeota archaeon]|jgi:membrane-bound metal-dependent hydrolase YbcI (DUF457 family)